MKIMVFTEGTLLMHKSAFGLAREKIVEQVVKGEKSVKDYESYIPVGDSLKKINQWIGQGAEIIYLTSRRTHKEVQDIQNVLDGFGFPRGLLEHRRFLESYKDVAERILPDVLIEDDCESIGGEIEMTYPRIKSEIKKKIKSVVVKEFGGIDHLSDNIKGL